MGLFGNHKKIRQKQYHNLFNSLSDDQLSSLTPSIAKRMLLETNVGKKERTFIEKRLGVAITKLRDYDAYLSTGSSKIWATYRACHLVSNVLASARFSITDKEGEVVDITKVNNDMSSLIISPNQFDSFTDLIILYTYHMKLTGNFYLLKDEVDGAGRPLRLFPLMPQYMRIVPHATEKVAYYEYSVNGQTIEYSIDDIIHFKKVHPTDTHLGMGEVEPSQELHSSYINRNSLNDKFIENGASPSGILSMKEDEDYDDEEFERATETWRKKYGGKKNVGKTAFLNGRWQYLKLGLTMQEMQSIENEKWTIEQIFLNHGVPLSVAGIEGSANYATSKQDSINFRTNECMPLLKIFVDKWNSDSGLSPLYDEGMSLNFEISGVLDVQKIVEDYGGLVDRGGMTPNQLRVKAGLEKSDDPYLDQYFVNRNLIPIVMAGVLDGERSIISDDV